IARRDGDDLRRRADEAGQGWRGVLARVARGRNERRPGRAGLARAGRAAKCLAAVAGRDDRQVAGPDDRERHVLGDDAEVAEQRVRRLAEATRLRRAAGGEDAEQIAATVALDLAALADALRTAGGEE